MYVQLNSSKKKKMKADKKHSFSKIRSAKKGPFLHVSININYWNNHKPSQHKLMETGSKQLIIKMFGLYLILY